MWPFGKKENKTDTRQPGVLCSYCGSSNTRLVIFHGTAQPGYVKIWRGQRLLTYRCDDCGRDFYAEEPHGGTDIESESANRLVDDEESLRAAEEEIRRQTEETGDRRFG
jgi:DNA-directed RNA polymerase subunit RPC12/RpoP